MKHKHLTLTNTIFIEFIKEILSVSIYSPTERNLGSVESTKNERKPRQAKRKSSVMSSINP